MKKLLLILIVIVFGCSVQTGMNREIESINKIHVFHYNNEQWVRGIMPFEPDTSRLIPAGICVNWLGDTTVNFPSYIMIDTTYKPASRINKFINRGLYSK